MRTRAFLMLVGLGAALHGSAAAGRVDFSRLRETPPVQDGVLELPEVRVR